MRNVGRIKLGYYPLPTAEGTRLRNLLQYPAEAASILDPCVGTGAALMQLTEGALVSRYGVELDADRALARSSSCGNRYRTRQPVRCGGKTRKLLSPLPQSALRLRSWIDR